MSRVGRFHRFRPALGGIVLLGVVARLAVMVPALGRPLDDPDNYLPIAASLAEGLGYSFQGRPTAYRPPLYPLLLAPGVALSSDANGPIAWVFGLHLALGAGTILAVALAARRWGYPGPIALGASAVVALDPVLVVQARAVMTETSAAFLVAATLAALGPRRTWRDMILGGLGLGLCALCRPSLLPAAGLAALAVLLPGDRAGFPTPPWKARVGRAFVLVLSVLAVLSPWAVRNALVFGEPIATTTHGGYTLALANNPAYYEDVLEGAPGAVWSGPNQRRWFEEMNIAIDGMTEPEADRYFLRLGLAMLRERPFDFARASAARLGRFWGVAPSPGVYPGPVRLATAAWTVPLWVLLAFGLVRRPSWRWPRFVATGLLLAITAVHAFYWTDLRMRAPILPAVALIALGAFARPPRVAEEMAPDPGP